MSTDFLSLRYPDHPTVAVMADRVGKLALRKLADDCGPGRRADEIAGLVQRSLPPALLDPLVLLVAELVLTLMTSKCGGDYDRAAAWLQSRPPFRFRTVRIKGAVRYLWHSRRQSDPMLAAWNPDLLAEAVEEQARGMTRASLMQLYPEAQRVLPGWSPPQNDGGMSPI